MKLPGLGELNEAEALTAFRNRESAALFAWNPFMHNPKLAGRLHRVGVPTLVLWGESDRVVTPDYGRAFAARIPGARFDTIAAAGHYPYLERPQEFVASVEGFLRE
jgi:pimeloyl-ACP methyl ester carboxylesterase